MNALFLVARILLVLVFIIVPLQVISASGRIAGAPPLRGVPSPQASIVAVSVVAITGAALVILGLWADLGALMIAAYLVPVTLVMHAFWKFHDEPQRKSHRESLLLNVSIFGGCLILFWALNQTQHVPAALVSTPLFGAW
jgi:putative oxidoreductase